VAMAKAPPDHVYGLWLISINESTHTRGSHLPLNLRFAVQLATHDQYLSKEWPTIAAVA